MKYRTLILTIAALSLWSCDIEKPIGGRLPTYECSLAPRKANYLWVRPTIEHGRFEIVISSYNQMMRTGLEYAGNWQQVDDPIPDIESLTSIKMNNEQGPVKFISLQKQAEKIENMKNDPGIYIDYPEALLPWLIEYRTDEVTDLRITADRTFLGEPAGTLLNRLFLICPTDVKGCWFPILYWHYGSYLGKDITNAHNIYSRTTLLKYPLSEILINRMLVPASALLRENGAPSVLSEEELQATITVEMTTSAGIRFRASHKIDTEPRAIEPFESYDAFICSIGDEYLAERIEG